MEPGGGVEPPSMVYETIILPIEITGLIKVTGSVAALS